MNDDYLEFYQNLGAAIIRRAIDDLKDKEYRVDALNWFQSNNFKTLCSLLKIDPNYLKRQIAEVNNATN